VTQSESQPQFIN